MCVVQIGLGVPYLATVWEGGPLSHVSRGGNRVVWPVV